MTHYGMTRDVIGHYVMVKPDLPVKARDQNYMIVKLCGHSVTRRGLKADSVRPNMTAFKSKSKKNLEIRATTLRMVPLILIYFR